VRTVSLPNLASKTMKLEHNPKLVSARDLADILMKADFDNVVAIVGWDKEGICLLNSRKR